MTDYVDGSSDPDDDHGGDRRQARKDKATSDDLAHQMFFSRKSKYAGSKAALARLRARRR